MTWWLLIWSIIFRLYWVDAQKDYIASCDLDGKDLKWVLNHHPMLVHPFSVTIHKDLVYWDDWEKKAIYMADKNTGKGVVKVIGDLAGAMDMKAFNRLYQVNRFGFLSGRPKPFKPTLVKVFEAILNFSQLRSCRLIIIFRRIKFPQSLCNYHPEPKI